MGISAFPGFITSLADSAVEAYRTGVQAQIEHRRLDSLRINLMISASVATVGMVVEAIALQLRVSALQGAVEEAVAAGDLVNAEVLRGRLVTLLEEPTASARLLATLGDYITAVMAAQDNDDALVIEGDII